MPNEILNVAQRPDLALKLSTASVESHSFFSDRPELWAVLRGKVLNFLYDIVTEEDIRNANNSQP